MKKWETPMLTLLGVDQTKAAFDVEGSLIKTKPSRKPYTCQYKSSSSDSSNDGPSSDSSDACNYGS